MKLARFFKKDGDSNWTIVVTTTTTDTYTGVVVDIETRYVVAGNIYFSNKVGKEVELTLVDSPKLKKKVCTGIKVVG